MVTVKWLPEALYDIERLHSHLNNKDPEAAARAAKTILEAANILQSMSRVGRPMPDETGRRELLVPFGAGAYILRYIQENKNTVVVIRVWHSREIRDGDN